MYFSHNEALSTIPKSLERDNKPKLRLFFEAEKKTVNAKSHHNLQNLPTILSNETTAENSTR
jgi:hypothetical protein